LDADESTRSPPPRRRGARGTKAIFADRDLQAIGGEFVGHCLVLLGHALVLGMPAFGIVGLHPARDFDHVRIGIPALGNHAHFHLAAAWQTRGRIENLLDFLRIWNLRGRASQSERHHCHARRRHPHEVAPVERLAHERLAFHHA
jgi:hypothetical protein